MTVEEVRKLIEELHLRVPKDFQKMDTNQLSKDLRSVMEFERQIFERIENLDKNGTEQDLIKYAKMICKNIIEKEIADIQEIYLKKIDSEYLNSK